MALAPAGAASGSLTPSMGAPSSPLPSWEEADSAIWLSADSRLRRLKKPILRAYSGLPEPASQPYRRARDSQPISRSLPWTTATSSPLRI